MARPKTSKISSRKEPKQARSKDLVAAILEAAIQVLKKEGAQRFTSARVAEMAGVSVGSLYQYFPNKAAILFRLQSDEWQQTSNMLIAILENSNKTPLMRLRELVHAFVRSECEEAELRLALNDAAPLYRDTQEARQAHNSGEQAFHKFLRQALPDLSKQNFAITADLVLTTLSSVAKDFSGNERTPTEIKRYSDAMADMLCAYIESLAKK